MENRKQNRRAHYRNFSLLIFANFLKLDFFTRPRAFSKNRLCATANNSCKVGGWLSHKPGGMIFPSMIALWSVLLNYITWCHRPQVCEQLAHVLLKGWSRTRERPNRESDTLTTIRDTITIKEIIILYYNIDKRNKWTTSCHTGQGVEHKALARRP